MHTADFDFQLPPELIAQFPAPERDQSRLLVLHRHDGRCEHHKFCDLLGYLRPGDVLVLNNSRVIPARLRGFNAKTGGAFELLLLEEEGPNDWWAMLKPGKRARIGTRIEIQPPTRREKSDQIRESKLQEVSATVLATNEEGHRRLQFSGCENILTALEELGEVPLPPYIRRNPSEGRVARVPKSPANDGTRETRPSDSAFDRQRYQTVFAKTAGSVAAPTAGLHFTHKLLDEVRALGVDVQFITLHVGLGTFAPVKSESLAAHVMHEERFEVSAAAARAVNAAGSEGRRIIAVGTTTVRVLESVAAANAGNLVAGASRTRMFIHSPHQFRIVNALLTNFHLPCSTLLMLVSAFAAPGELRGREVILSAYAEAIRERYRFFSYGDAMLLL